MGCIRKHTRSSKPWLENHAKKQLKLSGGKKLINADRLVNPNASLYGDARYAYGDASKIWGDITGVTGDVSGLCRCVSGVYGFVSDNSGDVSNLRGNLTRISGPLDGLFGDVEDIIEILEKHCHEMQKIKK